jgi:uncharacterized membrane protein
MWRNPLIRWACVILPLVQAAIEFYYSQPFWGLLFGALGVAALWVLVITWKGNEPAP